MPYPTTYEREFGFQSFADGHPGVPAPGNQFDSEYDAIAAAVNETIAFLKQSIRSDGKLANGSVGIDQVSADFKLGFKTPTTWAPFTAYTIDDTVWNSGVFYACNTAHTSAGIFNPAYWTVIADFGAAAVAYTNSAAASAAAATNAAATVTASVNQRVGFVDILANAKTLFGASAVVPNSFCLTVTGRTAFNDGYGGDFAYDSADSSSTFTADGLGFVDNQGRRWKRLYRGIVLLATWFGAAGSASAGTNVTAFRNAAIAARAIQTGNLLYVTIRIPRDVYSMDDYLPVVRNILWEGEGHFGTTLRFTGTGPNVIATAVLSGTTFTKNTSDNFATLVGGTHAIGGGLYNLIITAYAADCTINGEKVMIHMNGSGEGVFDRVYLVMSDQAGGYNGINIDNGVGIRTGYIRVDGPDNIGINGYGLQVTGQTNGPTPITVLIQYGFAKAVILGGQSASLAGGIIHSCSLAVQQLGNNPSLDCSSLRVEGCTTIVQWGDTGSPVRSARVVNLGTYSGCTNVLRNVAALNSHWDHSNQVQSGSISGTYFNSDDSPAINAGNVFEIVGTPVGFSMASVGLGANKGRNILRVFGTTDSGNSQRYVEFETETGRRISAFLGAWLKADLPAATAVAVGVPAVYVSNAAAGAGWYATNGTNWISQKDESTVLS